MLRRLLRYAAPHRCVLAGVLASMLATTFLETLKAWPLKFVVDNVLAHQPFPARLHALDGGTPGVLLLLAASLYIALAALRGGCAYLRDRGIGRVSAELSLAMRDDLYAHLQRLPLRFHDRARVGDTVARLTADATNLQNAFVDMASQFTVDLVTVLGIGVAMAVVDWRFALVSLTVLPPLYAVYVAFRRRIKSASHTARSGEGTVAAVATEALSSIRIVKAFGQEAAEQERVRTPARVVAAAVVREVAGEGLLALWVEVITAVGTALVIGYGGWRVATGTLSVGEMLLFLQYLTALYLPLKRLSKLTGTVQKASASAARIAELFAADTEADAPVDAAPLGGGVRGGIVLEDVWFGHAPGHPILKGVNLAVSPGETVAIIGGTGNGKTSLINLIPRFYDPTVGRVLIDGRDIRTVRLADLRAQISLVLQDAVLFRGSVRENIAYARPGATDREIVAAARAAHAHEFIAGLPQGYETPVGERGITLSGGQRQRIALARAILKDAPILIMDEPTSALDGESERMIMEALRDLMRGRTVLIVTHRLSMTALADRVVELKDGAITTVHQRDRVPMPHRAREHAVA